MTRHSFGGVVEGVDLVERTDLVLIREEYVDVTFDEIEELVSVTIDAEAIGKGEGDRSPHRRGPLHHGSKSGLRRGLIPQVSLEVDDTCLGHEVEIDVLDRELAGDPE